jgi:hypothetical protein
MFERLKAVLGVRVGRICRLLAVPCRCKFGEVVRFVFQLRQIPKH